MFRGPREAAEALLISYQGGVMAGSEILVIVDNQGIVRAVRRWIS